MVIVDDANAKSPDHIILMPRDNSINEIASLRSIHLPLLYRFREQANIEIHRMMRADPERIPMFRVGFHVIPSLFPLHCHVHDVSLSTDKMFHPRHWKVNFSNMLISLDAVIEEVERTGRMTLDIDAYRHDWVTKPIRCPACPGPQQRWENDITKLASHWRGHIEQWKATKTLPPNVKPTGQWEPRYPVILTTRNRSGFIGFPAAELDHLKKDFPSIEVHSYYTDEWPSIPKYVLDKATIFLAAVELPPAEYTLPRLEWIHLASSGLDMLTNSPHYSQRTNLQVTTSTGSGSAAIAEWVIMNTLLLTRNMLTALHNQANHAWSPHQLTGYRTLSQLSVGIIGFGSIGQHVAERFLALGTREVTAINPRSLPPSLSTTSPGSQLSRVTVLSADGNNKHTLHTFLHNQDILVLAAPLTPETRGLIGAAELAALRKGAVVLNVARGPLLDEKALAEALRSGDLAGAALDVVDQEPLGVGEGLWDLEGVVVTPHVAGMHGQYNQNVLEIFEESLKAHLEDRPMRVLPRRLTHRDRLSGALDRWKRT